MPCCKLFFHQLISPVGGDNVTLLYLQCPHSTWHEAGVQETHSAGMNVSVAYGTSLSVLGLGSFMAMLQVKHLDSVPPGIFS